MSRYAVSKSPGTTDRRYRAEALSNPAADGSYAPGLRQRFEAYFEYCTAPLPADNHNIRNPASSSGVPASRTGQCHAPAASAPPADRPDCRFPPGSSQPMRFQTDPLCRVLATMSRRMNSDIGERQILPWQMKSIFIIFL